MISIVVPTYNEEKILDEMLRQFDGIKSEPFELIVSDNKSEDDTVKLARRHTNKIVLNNDISRFTIGVARNRGVEIAQNPIIMFVDVGVQIPNIEDFMEHIANHFKKNPKCAAMTVRLGVTKKHATFWDKLIFGVIDKWFWISNNFFKRGLSHGKFMAVRAEAFRKIGGFDAKLAAGEDVDLFSRLAKVGDTFFDRSLIVFHSARRAHKYGWPKLLFIWAINGISVLFFKRSTSKEWKDVR